MNPIGSAFRRDDLRSVHAVAPRVVVRFARPLIDEILPGSVSGGSDSARAAGT